MNDKLWIMNDPRAHIESVLKSDVAAALELDPAEMTVTAFDDGIVSIRFGPVCSNCPGGMMVLVQSVEAELKARVSNVEIVEAVI
jgi:Fe-S cluster biogenesis protein NfuA